MDEAVGQSSGDDCAKLAHAPQQFPRCVEIAALLRPTLQAREKASASAMLHGNSPAWIAMCNAAAPRAKRLTTERTWGCALWTIAAASGKARHVSRASASCVLISA